MQQNDGREPCDENAGGGYNSRYHLELEDIFEYFDQWRGLPNYQLERRIDIFFALYLKKIVESHYAGASKPLNLQNVIVPEFPLSKSLFGDGIKTNHSVKVDYALFSEQRDKIILLELKTDSKSIEREQMTRMSKVASQHRWGDIFDALKSIMMAGNKKKYFNLVLQLAQTNMIEPLSKDKLRNRDQEIEEITSSFRDATIEIAYIVPSKKAIAKDWWCSKIEVIDFCKIARLLDKESDPLAPIFARYLRKWAED